MAIDAQGPERVRPFAELAGATYPVLVDREGILAELFGFKVIPNAFILDEKSILRYQQTGGFSIKKPEMRNDIERVLAQHFPESGKAAPREISRTTAAALFAQGVEHYQAGRIAEAVDAWQRAWQIDPENFVIRKQIWAVTAPDRFYPRIDFEWQKERIERGE